MKIAQLVNGFLRKHGAELKRYPCDDLMRRMLLLKGSKVRKIFDVGANRGQYGILMRSLGYDGLIVSFEPLSEAFNELRKNAAKYREWIAVNAALGDRDGEAFINVAANLQSSSILEMLPSHIKSAPDSVYVKKEKIRINRIDSIIDGYAGPDENIFLKIDTQGFEKNVLEGAKRSMRRIKGVQMEMSLSPLYKGETPFIEMIGYMKSMGFSLCSIENGFFDQESGRLLQVDGIFLK